MNKINEFLAKPLVSMGGFDVTPAVIVLVLLVYVTFIRK